MSLNHGAIILQQKVFDKEKKSAELGKLMRFRPDLYVLTYVHLEEHEKEATKHVDASQLVIKEE